MDRLIFTVFQPTKVNVILNSVIIVIIDTMFLSKWLNGCSWLILRKKLIIFHCLAMIFHRYMLRVLFEVGDNATPIFVFGWADYSFTNRNGSPNWLANCLQYWDIILFKLSSFRKMDVCACFVVQINPLMNWHCSTHLVDIHQLILPFCPSAFSLCRTLQNIFLMSLPLLALIIWLRFLSDMKCFPNFHPKCLKALLLIVLKEILQANPM